ncbi:MAG: hypothetical protein EP329_01465 [Deltaproteobacteria bacterium]|nr:MAG: hypothetical protein EP329_01465 [Deltaproteobacteria bacterium]
MDTCTRHALNGADGVVSTVYTDFAGLSFAHSYPEILVPIQGAATLADPAHWKDGTLPAACDGYRNPPAGYLYGGEGDGIYTIDPLQNANPVDVYCDMTTDGGGWTRIFAYVNGNGEFNTLNRLSALNAGLAAAATDTGYAAPTTIAPWYGAAAFTTMRFECFKPVVGRQVDLATSTAAVITYLTGGSSTMPVAPGTVTALPADASIMSGATSGVANGGPSSGATFSGPAAWGYDGTNFYTGHWSHVGIAADDRFSYAPFFIGYTAHFHHAGVRTECDDYDATGATGHEGYWYIWVR